ncbi:MAG: Na+/proline symporter [Lentimonas sp.]|jgi:Na+/proline symporter
MLEYFVAGRKMTWWLAGTSIVATSFAADTPLVISGWMRTIGLERNWFWWGGIMGMMLCTFFFARLWRRANILTDVEFNEMRYGGAPAAGLRIFHATYRSLIQNTLVMCWVTLAMSKILEVTLNLPTIVFIDGSLFPQMVASGIDVMSHFDSETIANWPIIGQAIIEPKITGIVICLSVAALYSAISGLWGVMVTDFFQFCLAMTGTIILMFVVLAVVDGPKNMVEQARAAILEGRVINHQPIDRTLIDHNEDLEIAGLLSQNETGDTWVWTATGLSEEQLITRLVQADVEEADSALALWQKSFTLSKGKFTDFDEVEKMLAAGILIEDTVNGQVAEYYRIPDVTLSEEVLLEQLSQAGVENKGEVMAAWRDDTVVSARKITSFLPPFDLKGGGLLAVWSLVVFLGLQWWAGGEGGGFLAQRLFSCKNEKHSMMAMLWFNFANFVLRPWPWIVVGVASLILIPDVTVFGAHYDPEHAYVIMLMKFLPVGLKGLMVAALMAAYMSTISTHVNFGASYIVNDLYCRFINRSASERGKVMVSQVASVFLAILAGVAAYYATNIGGLWLTMFELMSGAGFVILLRWYWWRISAWSELSAMVSTLGMWVLLNRTEVFHGLFEMVGWPLYLLDDYAVRFTFNMVVTTIVWVIVTFLTPPEKEEVLIKFYKRIKPGGWWKDIPSKSGNANHLVIGKLEWSCWALGVTGLFAMIVCLGKLCFGLYLQSALFGFYGLIATIVLFKLIGKMDWSAIEADE